MMTDVGNLLNKAEEVSSAVTLLTCIRELLGSSFGRDIECPGVLCALLGPYRRISVQWHEIVLLSHTSRLSLLTHSTIRRGAVRATDGVFIMSLQSSS
jgi:hypothetical protein